MSTPIVIEVGNLKLKASLNDSSTARAVAKALPIETEFQTWGDGFFFETTIATKETAPPTMELEVGDIAYTPGSGVIGIYYGPTPASPSSSDRPVPADGVHAIGKLEDDPTILRVVAPVGHLRLIKGKKSKSP